MVAEGTDVLAHEVRIEARPEIVFEFLTDPDKMTQWKGDSAQLDARPGGVYRVQIGQAVVVGEFVELDPPRRVVFTWGWEGNDAVPPGSTTVEVTLTPDGEATILRLVHRDLPEEQRAEHEGGWKHFLPRLAIAAVRDNRGSGPGAG
ncbi:MAG TPA: SRPBCC domain-containing protein [Actinomycetota bacterium]|nr:SRPBCC domain-containing protein [Actinomycetota bacterium]